MERFFQFFQCFQDLSEAMVLDKDGQPKWRSWPNILQPTSMDRSRHLQHPILQQQSPPTIWGKYKYFLHRRRYISWKSYDEKFICWRQTRGKEREILIIIQERKKIIFFLVKKKKAKNWIFIKAQPMVDHEGFIRS